MRRKGIHTGNTDFPAPRETTVAPTLRNASSAADYSLSTAFADDLRDQMVLDLASAVEFNR